jgi:predicted Zn finger-like uncharacterized protein
MLVIACPDCGKQIKVSEEHIGRKIRCKQCDAVFPIRKPAEQTKNKSKTANPPIRNPKNEEKLRIEDEEENDPNDYGLAEEQESRPRCPHCASELASQNARICLNCGYDLMKRTRAVSKAVYEPTKEERFNWLLPGILCAVGFVSVIVISILIMSFTEGWMTDGWFQKDLEDGGGWWVNPGCFKCLNGAISIIACFYMGRFAVRRLIFNREPPEKLIDKDDLDMEDDDDDYDDDDYDDDED